MNQAAADAISNALAGGLTHPGDDNNPPYALPLAMFRTTGLPSDEIDRVNAITKQVGEAIVNTLEADYEIVSKAEIEQLRTYATQNPAAKTVEVRCTCGTWLFNLGIRNGDLTKPAVNGRAVINAIQALSPECATGHQH